MTLPTTTARRGDEASNEGVQLRPNQQQGMTLPKNFNIISLIDSHFHSLERYTLTFSNCQLCPLNTKRKLTMLLDACIMFINRNFAINVCNLQKINSSGSKCIMVSDFFSTSFVVFFTKNL
jgi:hypothetical protein